MKRTTNIWIVLTLLTAACGSGTVSNEPQSVATITAEVPTSVNTATTTTKPQIVSPDTTMAEDEELVVRKATELEYLNDGVDSWTVDVYYPEQDGSWPLVVIFPGACDNCTAGAQSSIVAALGAVVVAPRYWHGPSSDTATEYFIDGAHNDRAACAVGYAQSIAVEYGGLADQTTVVGFSAGVHPAGWVGLGLADSETCPEPITHLPIGLVVGDSQFIFQNPRWDDAFQTQPGKAIDMVDRFLNPDRWNIPQKLVVFLWSTESTLEARPIDDPPLSESWVWSRDSTGTLVDDLVAVGAFENKQVDFHDNALLLEKRMLETGISVTNKLYPGPHTYPAEVYDAIMEVAAAGSR